MAEYVCNEKGAKAKWSLKGECEGTRVRTPAKDLKYAASRHDVELVLMAPG